MIGIFILARMGSSRLRHKHMISAQGKTFMHCLVERINHEFETEIAAGKAQVFIATANEPENQAFEAIAAEVGAKVFYGHINNIPLRQDECARHNHIDTIISVDGDDILCSTEAMRIVVNLLHAQPEVIAKTAGLPLGMNIMGYKAQTLHTAVAHIQYSRQLDTGWGRIFDATPAIIYQYPVKKDWDTLRMTLDYEPDAQFFATVIDHFGTAITSVSDADMIAAIVENQYQNINNHLNEEYFHNFNQQNQQQLSNEL